MPLHAAFTCSRRASLYISPQPFLISGKQITWFFMPSLATSCELDLLLWFTICFVYHDTRSVKACLWIGAWNLLQWFCELIMKFYLGYSFSHIQLTGKSRISLHLASSQLQCPSGFQKSAHHDLSYGKGIFIHGKAVLWWGGTWDSLLATLSTLASHLQGRYSPHSLMCLMDECE